MSARKKKIEKARKALDKLKGENQAILEFVERQAERLRN
jgi:hypothetical protein